MTEAEPVQPVLQSLSGTTALGTSDASCSRQDLLHAVCMLGPHSRINILYYHLSCFSPFSVAIVSVVVTLRYLSWLLKPTMTSQTYNDITASQTLNNPGVRSFS